MKKRLAKPKVQDAKQRVNIDFPLELLKTIDAECRRIGITRQGWIKMACDEKLRRTQATRIAKAMQ